MIDEHSITVADLPNYFWVETLQRWNFISAKKSRAHLRRLLNIILDWFYVLNSC